MSCQHKQSRVIWEEDTSIKEIPLQYWPVRKPVYSTLRRLVSAPASRFLPQVPTLISLDDELQAISLKNSLLPQDDFCHAF